MQEIKDYTVLPCLKGEKDAVIITHGIIIESIDRLKLSTVTMVKGDLLISDKKGAYLSYNGFPDFDLSSGLRIIELTPEGTISSTAKLSSY